MGISKRVILITGAAGFVGSHMVEHFLKNTDDKIIGVDALTYAGTWNRLRDIDLEIPNKDKGVYPDGHVTLYPDEIVSAYEHPRFTSMVYDFRQPAEPNLIRELSEVTHIIHMGAESHVDNSIKDPLKFTVTNVDGTVNMLNLARELPNLELFTYFSCYDEKTRALTKEGLKSFDEITENDLVYSIDQETGELEETKIEKVIIQDYEGKMIQFGGKRHNLLVTPNHRMYYETTTGVRKWEEASEMFKKTGLKQQSGKWRGKHFNVFELGRKHQLPCQLDTPEKTKAFMYVCGFFCGDGFTAYQEKTYTSTKHKSRCTKTGQFRWVEGESYDVTSKSWRIWFDVPEQDPARVVLENALKILGISFTRQKNKSGEHVYFTSEKWLKFFDSTFGKNAHTKKIPSWLKEQTPLLLQHLFDGLIDSDGHRRPDGVNTFSTVSRSLAESIVEIGFKLGFHPRFSLNYNKENLFENRLIKGGWSYQVWFGKSTPRYYPKNNKTTPYQGKIWCLKLEKNKNFIVEREGVFTVSGNTDEVFGPAPMELLSLPQGESPGKGWKMTLDATKGNAYTYKGGLNEYYSDWVFKGYSEDDKHDPKNPYAASKSAAEMMVVAFANTYGLPSIITRQMNIFGERQHPEKFIPICIRKAFYGGDINIHASADKSKAGMRHYIHARNVADAHLHLLNEKPWLRNTGFPREVESYHIVGELEVDNLTLARTINEYTGYIAETLKIVPEGVTNFNMVDFHSSRPGHDLRYALDGSKMKGLGWQPPKTFHQSLKKTIEWSLKNLNWINLEGET